MKFRAQSATEFLLTYSWAVVIMLAFIAALYYLGVLQGSNYIQRSCVFPSGLDCSSYKLMKNATQMQLVIAGYNGLGYDIGFEANRATITAENVGKIGRYTYNGTCAPALTHRGDRYTCVFNITNMSRVPATGDMVKMDISVAYRNCESDPAYRASGNCSTPSVQNRSVTGQVTTQMEQFVPMTLCNNSQCEDTLGETSGTCPADCASWAQTVVLTASPSFLYANSSAGNLTALVYDQFGRPYSGVNCNFTKNSTLGTITPASRTTNASGIANVTLNAGTTPGQILVNASCGNATKSAFNVRVVRLLNAS